MLAFLICAVGFSQQQAGDKPTSFSSVDASQYQKSATQTAVSNVKRTITAAQRNAEKQFGSSSQNTQRNATVNYSANSMEVVSGANLVLGPQNITYSTSNYNGHSYTNRGASELLYTSGPYFNQAGTPDLSILEDVTLGMDTFGAGVQITSGNRIADDIVIAEDADITEMVFYAYQSFTPTAPPTINAINVQVWDGDPSDPASSVIFGDDVTNVLDGVVWSGAFRVLEGSPTNTDRAIHRITVDVTGLSLTAGTYWVDWQIGGTAGSGPWQPPVAILGQTVTGNAQQSLAGVWAPLLDGGTSTAQGVPIEVFGTVTGGGGGGCPIASDCNLIDTLPDDSDPASPTWDRPFADGTCCSTLGPVSYDVYGPFTVDTAGDYDILSVQTGWDGYLFLYETCFDPLDQETNYVAGDDDGAGGVGTSDIIGVALTTGTEYYIVTTAFSAGDFGDFETTITGPGTFTCGAGGTTCEVGDYATQAAFDASTVDGVILFEDLAGGPAAGTTVTSCTGPFSGAGDSCYPAGEILDGIEVTSFDIVANAPEGMVWLETGFFGLPEDVIGANFFDDVTVINFPDNNVDSFSFNVYNFIFNTSDTEIRIFGTSGLIDTFVINAQPPSGAFFGYVAGEIITSVEIESLNDEGELIGSISFGTCETPVTNDECENAINLECGDIFIGETLTDTDSGSNPSNDEWFSFTGDGAPQIVTLSTCNTADFDTLLRVFDACGGNEIATNDDAAGCAGFTSELTFVSDGVSEYLIMVEGFGTAAGNFELSVTCADPLPGDFCDDALPIACGETVIGNTVGYTVDDSEECGTSITAPGVWYTFTDTFGFPTEYVVSLCDGGTTYDSKLTIYTGADCDNLVCVGDNDDSCGLQSEVAFTGDGVSTYYVLVHGFLGSTGDYSLNISCVGVAPDNDLIANAISLNDVGCPFTDEGVVFPAATLEGGNPTDCNIDGANGVWYSFTPEGNGTITCTIATPAGASYVNFFTAPDESSTEDELVLVDWFDNQCVPSTSTTIPTVAGQAYYVFVVNTGGASDVVFDNCDSLGVLDNTIEGFVFYPNPSNDIINLGADQNIDSVSLFNILGQKVIEQTVGATTGQLNVSNIAAGAYLMQVTVNGQVGTYKVMKR